MNWMRLYQEARTDKKLESLTDGQFRVWFNLLCFSGDQELRGTIEYDDLDLLAVEVASGETDLLSETLARLVKLKIVTNEDGAVFFLNFEKRQYDKPSDTPERVAERVRRHRENKRNGDVTPCNAPVTSSNTLDTELDTDTELEEINVNSPTPLSDEKRSMSNAKSDLAGFKEFYDRYPKQVKPATAERAWTKLKPDERQAAIAAIDRQKGWPEMTGDPKYIPHPSTWLNARSWEDEPPKFVNGGSINGHVPRRTGGAAAGGMTPQEFDAHIAELERKGL